MFELQEQAYLFLFSRQASLWQLYPPVPPPLNLFSLPYLLVSSLVNLPFRLVAGCRALCMCYRDGSSAFRHNRARTEEPAAPPPSIQFPAKWLQTQSVERLAEIAEGFIAEHTSDIVCGATTRPQCGHLIPSVL